jgi:hypothetical protein
MPGSEVSAFEDDRGAYAGWIAGGLVILAVLAIGAGLWFHYHP